MQDRQSKSINSSDISISQSTQLDYAIPASKIASLSSGEFVGMVADNPEQKIALKMFHSEIQNDHEAIALEEKGYKPIPVVRDVSLAEIRENYDAIKSQISELLRSELKNISANENADSTKKISGIPDSRHKKKKVSRKQKVIATKPISL
jgi:hypothetical protein